MAYDLIVGDSPGKTDKISDAEFTHERFEGGAFGSRSDDAKNRLLLGRVHEIDPGLKEDIETHPRHEPTYGERDKGVVWKVQRCPRLGSVARHESLSVDARSNNMDVPRAHAVTLHQDAPVGACEDDKRIGPAVDDLLEPALQYAFHPPLAGQDTPVSHRAMKMHHEGPATKPTEKQGESPQGAVGVNDVGIGVPIDGRGQGPAPSRP